MKLKNMKDSNGCSYAQSSMIVFNTQMLTISKMLLWNNILILICVVLLLAILALLVYKSFFMKSKTQAKYVSVNPSQTYKKTPKTPWKWD